MVYPSSTLYPSSALYPSSGGGASPVSVVMYSIMITDLDGMPHTITEDIQQLSMTTELSDASDVFEFTIHNDGDEYLYIEKGCEVEISTGMDTPTKKISGVITEVFKTLDDSQTFPIISVCGEDGGIRLNHIYFSGRFYDLEVSALLKAILDTTDYTTGQTYRAIADVDASNTYIESTAYTIDEASYVWKSLSSAIKELADNVSYEWYRDTDKKLHFFDPSGTAVSEQITDSDLEGSPEITNVGDIVNRVVVIGGFQQNTDRSGNPQTTTTTVTDSVAKNQSFVPTEDFVSSILIYTELVAGSTSALTLSLQKNSGGAPDGENIASGVRTEKVDAIVDGDYTEFRFSQDVTLTPGTTYWIVLTGSTSNGVDVGVDGGGVLDYVTRYPVRVAILTEDEASQDKYGMYMEVYRNNKVEDSEYAEQIASSLLQGAPKKVAQLVVRGDSISVGMVVNLALSETGITIDKNMKVLSSTQTLDTRFIYNELIMEEV